MSKKKCIKILSIALMVVMIAMCLSNVALADVDYSPEGTGGKASASIGTIINFILGIAQVVGIGVAVIMLVVLAIKYISAAPGDKAEIKKHAVMYIVGAVVLFAASALVTLIRTFVEDAFQ